MHIRKAVGYVTGTLSLLLLAGLAIHVVVTHRETVTPGLLILALVDVMLWMLGLRLACDATAYVSGVRETVDRLASALKTRPH